MRWKSVLQLVLTGVGLFPLVIVLWLLQPLSSATTVQAAPAAPVSGARLQARAAVTHYLPVVIRTPTPEYELLVLINAERQSRGLGTVTPHPALRRAAESHSLDMLRRGFFSHTNPDGEDPGDRLDRAGYNASAWGENIAYGYPTATAVFAAWMSSEGHRENLLNPNLTEIGLGYIKDGHFWTTALARPW